MEKASDLYILCNRDTAMYTKIVKFMRKHPELHGSRPEEVVARYKYIHALCDGFGIRYSEFALYRSRVPDAFLGIETEEEQIKMYAKIRKYRGCAQKAGADILSFLLWLEDHYKEVDGLSIEEQVGVYLERNKIKINKRGDSYRAYCKEMGVSYGSFLAWKVAHPELIGDDKKENIRIFMRMVRPCPRVEGGSEMHGVCMEYGVDYVICRQYISANKDLVQSFGYRDSAIRYCICHELRVGRTSFPKLIRVISRTDFARRVADYIVRKHMETTPVNDKLTYCHCKHCGQDGVMTAKMMLEHLKDCYYAEDGQKTAINTLMEYLNS